MAALPPAYPELATGTADLQPILDAIAVLQADLLDEIQDRADADALLDQRITTVVGRVDTLELTVADLQTQIDAIPSQIDTAIDIAIGSCDFEQAFLDELNSP